MGRGVVPGPTASEVQEKEAKESAARLEKARLDAEKNRADAKTKLGIEEKVDSSTFANVCKAACKTIRAITNAAKDANGALQQSLEGTIGAEYKAILEANPFFRDFNFSDIGGTPSTISSLEEGLKSSAAELQQVRDTLAKLNGASAFAELFGVGVNATDAEVLAWLSALPAPLLSEYDHAQKALTGAVDFAFAHQPS
ncbi:MAG UNVERIFIED_CONTAM: hypothetical protein LVQ98_01835 [Rickettsiaceae bacterium]|jgi:hypothetical protein